MTEIVHVLIVEDLPTDAELTEREVRKALGACRFRRVETREDYVAALEDLQPALIVSDFKLPRFDGLSALKLALEHCPDVPFIILTGSMNEDTAVECMKAGAWEYVIKEHIKRLGPAVRSALELQRVRTERKRAEHALEASETRYRRLVEAAKDGILILDADTGKIVDVNPFLLELTGYSRDDFLGKHLWEIGSLKDIAASRSSFAELKTKRYVRYDDLPLETRDGRKIDVEFVSNVYRADGQNVIQCNIRDITARKRAERRILEQGATLNAILDSTESPTFALDREYRYTAFNRAHAVVMKALYGADIQVGSSLPEYQTVREDWQAARKNLDCALHGETVLESAFSGDEGLSRRYFEVAHHPVRTDAGEIIGVSVFAREVTEAKRAEEELRFRNLILSTQQEAAIDGILVVDVNGRIVSSNGRFAEMWGIPPEVVESRSDARALDAVLDQLAAPEEFIAGVKQLYARPDEKSRDEVLLRDGRTFDRYSAPMIGPDGKSFGRVWYFRDITERKRAEAELLNKTALLEAQANSTIDGILVVDGQGKKIFQNQRTIELWKIPPHIADDSDDSAQVRHVTGSTKYPEQFVERIVHLYGHPDETSSDEVELLDGTVLDRFSAPVLGKDGQNYGRIWTFRDITERRRAEAEQKALAEQLRATQKMEAIGSLAGGVAHDFNNLLSVILSFAGFALEALRQGDPVRHDLLEVKKAGESAAALTRQLVAFGRKQVLQPKPLSLNQIATGVEKLLRRVLGEDIDFVQVLAPDLGVTLADPGQVEQVLMNLVVNARDAMPAGGKLTIETSNVEIDEEHAARHVAVDPGSYVQLAVTDTGSGMDEQTKARIFEPFFTTKEKGKGTGLGLSTVYGIVRQSGGNIWVYSEPGLGTTFKIYFPRDFSTMARDTRPPPTVSRRPTGGETILVVEDEEALRNVARRALDAAGYEVLIAADGNEAIRTAAENRGNIHLLVTDVVMPRMSGNVLAQDLSRTRPALKVLYMSGYTDDAIVHHGVLDAGTHFLAKPFTGADLVRKVREVLDGGVRNPADGNDPAVEPDVEKQEQPLDQAGVRALPADVLGELRRAVIAARYDEMVELVETLRTTQPDVAAGLRRMADRFDYDGLGDLLGERKEEPSGR
jgi:two-component system cell cycle sensor histidine kinase/response regulator CckA